MNGKKSSQLMGILLIVFGIIIALTSFFAVLRIVFFKGWWAILILVLALYNMYKHGRTKQNTKAAVTGVVLFIISRTNIIGFIFSKMLIPVILLAIGIHMIRKN